MISLIKVLLHIHQKPCTHLLLLCFNQTLTRASKYLQLYITPDVGSIPTGCKAIDMINFLKLIISKKKNWINKE